MKTSNQKDIWNALATSWQTFRSKPVIEITSFLKKKKGRILDLCCGSGRNFTKTKGTLYGMDFSKTMLKLAKEHARKSKIKVILKEAGVEKLPFKNNFFDAAIFAAALHCIPSEKGRKKALEELYRVLKLNSEAVITVWDKNQRKKYSKGKELFIPWEHKGKKHMRYYYFYDKKEFQNLLQEVGFKIIKLSDNDNPEGLYSKKNLVALVKK